MPSRVTLRQKALSITAVAEYHRDAESLRLYFTSANPHFVVRFAGYVPAEVQKELADRLSETDMRFRPRHPRTRIEAAFRIDYQQRCRKKETDGVSIAFRRLQKGYGKDYWRVPLEQKIFETWRTVHPGTSRLLAS